MSRCSWVGKIKLEQIYHDNIWGKPMYDDKELFKMLMLEIMQAGLSWITVLKKMDYLCDAFDNFDPDKLLSHTDCRKEEILKNKNVIRNKLKIKAVYSNAEVYMNICKEYGSFNKYIWKFVNYSPIINDWNYGYEVPTKTDLSEIMSKDLKSKGFKFIGPTIVYSYMQATGMVNDHLNSCDFK